jgi:hypothetical protein
MNEEGFGLVPRMISTSYEEFWSSIDCLIQGMAQR